MADTTLFDLCVDLDARVGSSKFSRVVETYKRAVYDENKPQQKKLWVFIDERLAHEMRISPALRTAYASYLNGEFGVQKEVEAPKKAPVATPRASLWTQRLQDDPALLATVQIFTRDYGKATGDLQRTMLEEAFAEALLAADVGVKESEQVIKRITTNVKKGTVGKAHTADEIVAAGMADTVFAPEPAAKKVFVQKSENVPPNYNQLLRSNGALRRRVEMINANYGRVDENLRAFLEGELRVALTEAGVKAADVGMYEKLILRQVPKRQTENWR